MPMEIHELVIRVTVADPETPAPDWDALRRMLRAELLELCQDEIQTQLQRTGER